MNLTDAAHKARALMNAHGLSDIPFEFDRGRRRIAAAHYVRSTGQYTKITLSHHFASQMSENEVTHAILHEIAHVKAGADAGHGHMFKLHAQSLGIKGDRCMNPDVKIDKAWQGVCPNGHRSNSFHRAPLRVRSCGKCSPVFDSRYLFTWYKNGQRVSLAVMPERYRAEHKRITLKSVMVSG